MNGHEHAACSIFLYASIGIVESLQVAMIQYVLAALCVVFVEAQWRIPSSSCNFSRAMRDPDITGCVKKRPFPHISAVRLAAEVPAAWVPAPGEVSARHPASRMASWHLVLKGSPLICSRLIDSVCHICRWELQLIPPMSMLAPSAEPSRDLALTKVCACCESCLLRIY